MPFHYFVRFLCMFIGASLLMFRFIIALRSLMLFDAMSVSYQRREYGDFRVNSYQKCNNSIFFSRSTTYYSVELTETKSGHPLHWWTSRYRRDLHIFLCCWAGKCQWHYWCRSEFIKNVCLSTVSFWYIFF